MRVIAGSLKGKKIKSPDTIDTRPTLDRVKEAIFSMLSNKVEGSVFLDLFAGTGSISIEALSRGAKFCHINDCKKQAISTILYNIKLTNYTNCVKITMNDFLKCLRKLDAEDKKFDIIFLDPPYNLDYAYKTLEYISNNKGKILNDDGIIVYELDKKLDHKKYDELQNLECIKTRSYGRVLIRVYRWR